MTILLLKGYNNYFNRIRKQESSINAYKQASTSYLEYNNVNFDPKDGIATILVVGSEVQKANVVNSQNEIIGQEVLKFDDLGCPDYLICYETVNQVQTIKYRWFIVESVKITQGQYKLALKRDVLIDYGDSIMNSPCFVEKGWINNVENPLLLNSEGMKFNQIKQSEAFIKDNSHCAWLVGYVKKNIDASDLTNVNPISYTSQSAAASIPSSGEYDWEPCIQYLDSDGVPVNNTHKDCYYFFNSDISFRTWFNPSYFSFVAGNVRTKMTENYQLLQNSGEWANSDWGSLNSCAFDIPESHKVSDSEAAGIAHQIFAVTRDNEDVRSKFDAMVSTAKSAQFTSSTVLVNEDIFKYNGKQVVKDGHVYTLQINPGQDEKLTQYYTGNDSAAVSWMTSVASKIQYCNYNTDNPSKKKVQIDFRGRTYQIIAREVILNETVSFNFPVSDSRNECVDATYDMFCMPIDPTVLGLTTASTDNVVIAYTDGYDTKAIDLSSISDTQIAMAIALTTKLGANSDASLVYDLQLLPYCPFEDLNVYFENRIYGPTYNKWVINTDNYNSADFSFIYNNESDPEIRGIIFYPRHANFSAFCDYSLPNESVHYEWQEMVNPTLKAQGTYNGLPQYAIGFDDSEWPYEVTYNSVWDLGPNSNNPDDSDIIIEDGITKEECESIIAQISPGLKKPVIWLTSTEFPTPPTGQEYSYTFTGNFTVKVRAHWIVPDRPEDIKIKNECDMYRITSPNFMSIYEFKKTKLKEGLKSFNIDCTYKPFNPYIKVNPNYDDSLYAVQDFNDNMGLIITGDFSLPMLSDAWVNYELSNRNYQALFNRQIANLDVNQQIAKEQQQFQAITGSITASIGGAASGAVAGAKIGGPYGAAAGAVIGGVAGTSLGIAGGIADAQWLERQQTEARSFAIDQFNYQLGNVQALNATVTKGSPLTYNNKVWPILEYYTCTEEEKNVLRNKLKYDGMTIMAINTLRAYLGEGTRVKGQMIRLENLNDDSHIAQAIYEEVDKGFYEGV